MTEEVDDRTELKIIIFLLVMKTNISYILT